MRGPNHPRHSNVKTLGAFLPLRVPHAGWREEKHAPRFGMAMAEFSSITDKFYEPIQRLFPLPAGEGQGENSPKRNFAL